MFTVKLLSVKDDERGQDVQLTSGTRRVGGVSTNFTRQLASFL